MSCLRDVRVNIHFVWTCRCVRVNGVPAIDADWVTELRECGRDCQEVLTWRLMQPTRLSAVSQIPLCVCVCLSLNIKYHNETGNHCEDKKKFSLSPLLIQITR